MCTALRYHRRQRELVAVQHKNKMNTFAIAAKAENAASLTSGVPSLRHYIIQKTYRFEQFIIFQCRSDNSDHSSAPLTPKMYCNLSHVICPFNTRLFHIDKLP